MSRPATFYSSRRQALAERAQFKAHEIFSSLWFIPLLLAIIGGILSWAALNVPEEPLRRWELVNWLMHDAGAKHAHDLLGDLLTAMITMTSLVMSLTMVVLTIASSNLGPRLVPFFMGSRLTQVTHGIFMGTIVYLLLTLRIISEQMTSTELPDFAVTLGSLLTLLSLIMLIFFIHHLARSIMADAIIHYVGNGLDKQMKTYLKSTLHRQRAEPLGIPDGFILTLDHQGGYIESIKHSALVETLRAHDACLALHVVSGDFVLPMSHAGTLSVTPNDELVKALREGINLGKEPTAFQDIEYTLRQEVEIALRALSPSLHDPFTAIRAIDRLGMALQQAMPLTQPYAGFEDEQGICRLTVPIAPFSRLLYVAFNQIVISGSAMPEVLVRLLKTFTSLARQSNDSETLHVLEQYGEVVMRAAQENITEELQLEQVRKWLDRLKEATVT